MLPNGQHVLDRKLPRRALWIDKFCFPCHIDGVTFMVNMQETVTVKQHIVMKIMNEGDVWFHESDTLYGAYVPQHKSERSRSTEVAFRFNISPNKLRYFTAPIAVCVFLMTTLGSHIINTFPYEHQEPSCWNVYRHTDMPDLWYTRYCTFRVYVDSVHDDVIKWIHFPCCWPFVRVIHRWSVTRSFDVFFDRHLNKRLGKSIRRWFETPSRSIWHHCNVWLEMIFHDILLLLVIDLRQYSPKCVCL